MCTPPAWRRLVGFKQHPLAIVDLLRRAGAILDLNALAVAVERISVHGPAGQLDLGEPVFVVPGVGRPPAWSLLEALVAVGIERKCGRAGAIDRFDQLVGHVERVRCSSATVDLERTVRRWIVGITRVVAVRDAAAPLPRELVAHVVRPGDPRGVGLDPIDAVVGGVPRVAEAGKRRAG